MLMPDPASAMHDLERLLDLPCPEWTADMACRGVEMDCQGVAEGQHALRQALAGGGTYHDVLGRLGRAIEAAALPAKRRLIALAVADVARAQSRARVGLALRQLAGTGGPVPAGASC